MESCCVICAEPLQFCAFGPCHHQDVCSFCMARLRFLRSDKTCPICRNECPVVFITRHLDNNYTRRIPEDQWKEFEKQIKTPAARSPMFMKKIDAIIDDPDHFKLLDRMISLSHPKLEEVTDVSKLTIKGIKDLRRIIETKLNLHFCDLCVKHRPVFTSEQMLYTKEGLQVHKNKGDPDGPLKEANFKGHPKCSFCKTYFYDQTALFKHMEQHHYHCHLCRRENPDNYVYFRDYKHLEEHFDQKHFQCPFDECRQLKFVVFSTEAELRKHMMAEHAGEHSNMKRHERRAALTLETGFMTAPRHSHSHNHEPEFQRVMRPPTVIGGGGAGAISTDMRSRARAEEEQQARAAASVAAQQRQAANLDLSAETQFPGLGPNAAPSALMHRGWVGGPASRQVMNASFPTLGEATMSRGQKKKLKAKAKRAVGGEFGSTNDLPPAEVMAMGLDAAATGAAGQQSGASTPRSGAASSSQPSRQASPAIGGAPGLAAGRAGPSRAAQQRPLQNAFEGLAVDEPAPGAAPTAVPAPAAARVPARAAAAGPAPPDFPSLGGAGPARGGAAIGGWVSVGDKKAAPQPLAPQRPALNSKSAFPSLQGKAGGASGRPQSLAAAGNALFKKLQAKLSPADFAALKSVTRSLEGGWTTAQEYHDRVVCLGLAADVVQLMSTCSAPAARDAVLAVHADYINDGMPGEGAAWAPPEAVLAAAQAGGGRRVWECYVCEQQNEMAMEKCAQCGTVKAVSDAQQAEKRAAADKASQARANVQGGKKKKARAKPMTFQDVNRSSATPSAWRPK